jgi:threonine/homoserine/homoserine lactone efflux protein
MFVLTSLSIGLVALLHRGFNWLPVVMGMIGAGYLFYASVLLIMEVRIANAGLNLEFSFLNKVVRSHLEADTNRIHVP